MKPSILLRTKFMIPRQGTDRLPRPHLLEWLEKHIDRRLILISAPPGYGKTTLLADLAITTTLPVGWYQLDPADNDPTVFLTYLLETLRQIEGASNLGESAKTLLDSVDGELSPLRILTVLINELTDCLTGDWMVILEDYHLITNPALHNLVDYLLGKMFPAPGLHVLISTRVDPSLALPRLRARGMLAELRTRDLRLLREKFVLG
ncbi:MAG: hypothetical protein HC806_09745 [Anaerolineae bacterium]|nr:hypothetical protein [Anaerolineae bacterium]